MPVEPRLADQDLHAPPKRLGHALDLVAQLVQRVIAHGGGRIGNTRRRAVLTKRIPKRLSPLTSRHAGASSLDRRRHDVDRLVPSSVGEGSEGTVHRLLVALFTPRANSVD